MEPHFIAEEKIVVCGSVQKLLLDAENSDCVYTLAENMLVAENRLVKGRFVLNEEDIKTYTIQSDASLPFSTGQRFYDFQGDVKGDLGVFAYTSQGEEYVWNSWLVFFSTSDMRLLHNPIEIYSEEIVPRLVKRIGRTREQRASKPRIGHVHISPRHDFVVIEMMVDQVDEEAKEILTGFYCFRIYKVSTGQQVYETHLIEFLLVGTVYWHNDTTVRWLEGVHSTEIVGKRDTVGGGQIQLWTTSMQDDDRFGVRFGEPKKMYTVKLADNQQPMLCWFGEPLSGAEGGEESIGGVGGTGNGLVYADIRCMRSKSRRGWLQLKITPQGNLVQHGRVRDTEGELWGRIDGRYTFQIDGRYAMWCPLEGRCIVHDFHEEARLLALAMSQHPRLGQDSNMRMLGSVLRESILGRGR